MEHLILQYKEKISMWILLISMVYVLVAFSIALDLWSGVRKAKRCGTVRTSEGFRRTIGKVSQYYNCLLAITVIDIVLNAAIEIVQKSGYMTNIYNAPYITTILGIYFIFIEIRSIFENSSKSDKDMMSKDMQNLLDIIKRSPDIAEKIKAALN